MPCFLVFLRYDDQGECKVVRIPLEETRIQLAMIEGRREYRAQLNQSPNKHLKTPRLFCGTRNIPLHLHHTQVQPFSLQM